MELFTLTYIDIVGYHASALLVVSFLMKNMKTLRIINTFGCIAFIVYGFLLAISWPIIITNTFIVGANIYYLFFKKKTTNV